MNKPKFPKTEKIEIRCTPEQKKIIKERAESYGLAVSKYILMIAMMGQGDKHKQTGP